MRLGLNPQTRRSCIANATLRDATRTLIQNLITNYELRITNYLRPIHLNRTVLIPDRLRICFCTAKIQYWVQSSLPALYLATDSEYRIRWETYGEKVKTLNSKI
jgi:hypothetical protein